MSDRYICACGSDIRNTPASIRAHFATARHQNFVNGNSGRRHNRGEIIIIDSAEATVPVEEAVPMETTAVLMETTAFSETYATADQVADLWRDTNELWKDSAEIWADTKDLWEDNVSHHKSLEKAQNDINDLKNQVETLTVIIRQANLIDA